MSEKSEATTSDDSASELRNKLIKRLAVAGVLVAVLLGVLAFFDYLSSAPEEPDEAVFTKPVPVPPKKTVSQPVTPTAELPEPPAPAPVAAETPPPPQVAPQPTAAEAKPEVRAESKAENKPENKPEPRPANVVSAPPARTAVPVPEAKPASTLKPVRPVPEMTAAPTTSVAETPPPAQKPARVVETQQAAVAPPTGVSRLFSGFLLQAGVFASPQRAEELHAKLTLSGVPSTLETRVQVGPFRTRQEAEAAQAKLKELGVETVLVPPRGKH